MGSSIRRRHFIDVADTVAADGMMNFLVGQEGEIWPVGDLRDWSLPIHAELGGKSGAAIRCRDQACLVYGRGGGVKIGLRAGTFSRRCFERILSILTLRPASRLLLVFSDPRWLPEFFDNFNDAVARLDELRALTPGEAPRSAFFAEPLALERLDHPKRAELQAVFREWCESDGRLTTSGMVADVGNADVGNEDGGNGAKRMGTLLTRARGRDRLIVEDWPQRRAAVYPAWTSERLLGRELHEQPDPGYGQHAQKGYATVLREKMPRLEIVEAVVRPPDGPALRTRYERLLLPWTSPGGDVFISGTSITRSRRLLPAPEKAD